MRKRRTTGGRSSTALPAPARTHPSGRRPKSLNDELLQSHVERFNEGVRTGDFSRMLEQFTEDAELAFEGVPVGPFRGKPAIAQAYADQPPDDEIVILRTRESGENLVVADYAWRADPAARAGSMILRLRDAEIDRLLVTFG
ncbi:MAG TPA: nuclear transport factor 2 family protein [Gaiellaceae bacterium]|nr:nuclear transport factor 2 family protein [Gaiellaceae bacterium]